MTNKELGRWMRATVKQVAVAKKRAEAGKLLVVHHRELARAEALADFEITESGQVSEKTAKWLASAASQVRRFTDLSKGGDR